MTDHTHVALATHAMATRFELVLCGAHPIHLRAAGEEALEEIERLDAQLSIYRPESDVSHINARAAIEPVRVEPRLFRLLQRTGVLSEKTDGAFDVTIGPLMRAWDLAGGSGRVPSDKEIDDALACVGMRHVILDESDFTVRFDHEGVKIDLGAIGKGYAIERAVESLVENGVTSALIHGGTSSVHGVGSPPDSDAWRIGIAAPRAVSSDRTPKDVIELRDSSLSVSAVHGKSFTEDGVEYGHVIDPRTGRPVRHTLLAAVTGPSATDCDALSTALLVLGEGWVGEMEGRFVGYRGLVECEGPHNEGT